MVVAPRHGVEVVSQGEAEQESLTNLRDTVGLNLCGGQSKVALKGKDGKKIKPENIPEAQYIAGYNYFFVHNDKSTAFTTQPTPYSFFRVPTRI